MIRKLVPAVLLSLIALPLFGDADVTLSLRPGFPTSAIVNTEYTLEADLFVNGPDVARNVRVTFNIPPGLPIRSTTQPTCDITHVPVVCTAGDIPGGQPSSARSFSIRFTLPSAATTLTLGASATSDTPDPRPENNSATQTVEVVNETQFFIHTEIVPSRVDPGATTLAKTQLSNFAPSVPSDIHIHYEATNAAIEKIDAPSFWSCTTSGSTADCTAAALDPDCRCSRSINLTLRAANDRAGGTITLTPSATSSLKDVINPPIDMKATAQIYRWLVVTSTSDAGAGSLRGAIDQANAGCTTPCKIAFQIPAPVPSAGWFTIAPSTPLPAITADRVFIDGATQTAFTGDTNPAGPEIALDGRFTKSGHGLELHAGCDAIVEGLSVGNFVDHGLAFFAADCRSSTADDQRRAAHNYLGVDPTGAAAAPNLRGLMAEGAFVATDNVISGNRYSGVWMWRGTGSIDRNRIGTAADGKTPLPNGRSGIFFGPLVNFAEALENTISFNAEMGVAIARDAQLVDVRNNSMRRNGGLGIDIGLDGPNPLLPDDSKASPNAPTLLSAVYDPAANRTTVTLTVVTKPAYAYSNSNEINLYANDGPDGDGEVPILQTLLQGSTSGAPVTISFNGDFRGKWINATNTRVHFIASLPPSTQSVGGNSFAGGDTTTSEFSNAVLVQ